jgi:hypothetical protein
MKSFLLSFLLLLCASVIPAQDTIYKKNKGRVLAKVILVGTDTISYTKASMPDGPVYKLDKKEVSYIRYENGNVDYFEPQPKQEPLTNQGKPTETPAGASGLLRDPGKIIDFSNRRYYMNNRRLSQHRVSEIMVAQANPRVQGELNKYWKQKGIGIVCGFGCIPLTVIGGTCVLAGLIVSADTQSANASGTPYTGPSAGRFLGEGVVVLASAVAVNVIGKINKKRAVATYLRAIELYNAEYQ